MRKSGKLVALAPAAAIVAAGLLISLPVWLTGLPAGTDTVFHGSWYTHFARQFWSGELYPRWLSGMSGGLGSPVFFYYPPLPYHLTSLLAPLVPAGQYGLRHLAASTALSFVASGLAAHLWLRQISDRRGALAGAILYLLAPYHSVVDLFTRGAFSELWAFVWMPLVLYFVRRLVDDGDSRLAFAGLSVSYALLACTHLPATLIFSAVPICYAYSASGRSVAVVPRALAGLALGAGLAAAYLLPALTMQGHASFADMQAANYFERWITFEKANLHDLYGQLFWGALTSAGLVACAALLARAGRAAGDGSSAKVEGDGSSAKVRGGVRGAEGDELRDRVRGGRAEMIFWCVAAAISIVLTTFASGAVWRLVPVLQKVQFPWRFQLVLCLAVSGAVAAGVGSLRAGRVALNRRALVFACMIVAAWACFWAGAARRAYPDLPRGYVIGGGTARSLDAARDAPEYRPARADSNAEQYIENLLTEFCGDPGREVRACVSEGEGTVSVTRASPRMIDLRTESATGVTFRVTQFYFEGWAASLDGREHPVTASRSDGLLLVSAPAGTHHLRLTLEPTAPERAGLVVSTASALLLLFLVARPLLPKSKRRRAGSPDGLQPTPQG